MQYDEPPYESHCFDRFSNLYLAQSSLEDYKSVRFTNNGSPYIAQITMALEKWKTHNINEIFNEVAASMQYQYENLNLTPEFSVLGPVTSCHKNTFMNVLKASSRNLGNINSQYHILWLGRNLDHFFSCSYWVWAGHFGPSLGLGH